MRSSSLQSRTVRPGLSAYSFYRSDRHPASRQSAAQARPRHGRKIFMAVLLIALVALVSIGVTRAYEALQSNGAKAGQSFAVTDGAKQCAGNTLDKLIIVSVSEQHLWACHNQAVLYNSGVVTGREKLVENRTPRGTYHIYAKQTDTTLTGTDSTGQWRDPVRYWMPFLDNQYGTYGFHDATWRPGSDFGNIDPSSDKASHGCINLPLATAKWLYDWAPIGTTVTIKD